MPKFNTGLVRTDQLSLEKIDLPEISVGGKSVGYNYHKEMEAMFQSVKDRQEQPAAGLVVSNLDLGAVSLAIDSVDIGGNWKGFSTLTESELILEEAKKLVAQQQFQQALVLLEKVLRVEAKLEAVYLKAYCLLETKKVEESLVTIATLRHASLPPMLHARVDVLKEKIRKGMAEILFPEIMMRELLGRMQGTDSQTYEIIKRLQRLVELDPENGMYHYLLGAKLLETGQVKPALDAVTRGVRDTTTGDQEQLGRFQRHIEKIYLRQLLKPAVECFKQSDYRAARVEVNRLPSPYRNDPLTTAFDAYMSQLAGLAGRGSRNEDIPAPAASGDLLQDLYFLIVGDELDQAEQLFGMGQIAASEALLRRARQFAPGFARVNFALSSCVYMLARLEYILSRGVVDKGELATRLRQVRPYALIGKADGTDGENLVVAMDRFLERLDEEQYADSRIREFVRIMESAQGGIQDLAHLESIRKPMAVLNQKLSTEKRSLKSADISRAMDQLTEAVTKNLAQLDQMKVEIEAEQRDADILKPLMAEYQQIMQSLQSQSVTPDQIARASSRFSNLQPRISAARSQLIGSEAKDALAKLDQATRARIEEVSQAQAGMHERTIVEPLIQEFNQTMQGLSNHKISSRYELEQARYNFRNLLSRVETAERQVSSQDAREALGKLHSTINSILTQLGDY